MSRSGLQSVIAAALALAFALTVPGAGYAQKVRGQEGTGGAAGYSPVAPEPMNAPPAESGEAPEEAAPQPDVAPPVESGEAPEEAAPPGAPGSKEDESGPTPETLPDGSDQPD